MLDSRCMVMRTANEDVLPAADAADVTNRVQPLL
jgi:hypothetical protein